MKIPMKSGLSGRGGGGGSGGGATSASKARNTEGTYVNYPEIYGATETGAP